MNSRTSLPVIGRFGAFSPHRALALALATSITSAASGQITPHAGMLRFPDVSATHIVFVYADDLWLVPREGGLASPLASPPGLETFPRFSSDGKTIAFIGNYDGNNDVYTIAVEGGVPTRVTYHPSGEVLCDWTPDQRLMYFTNGYAGRDRQTQLFTVSPAGGISTPVPVPYGAFASIDPTGEWLAYTPHTADNRTWKRYRGGMATDIWLFNLKNKSAKRVTDFEGTDSQPMWNGKELFYMSDDGPSHKLNIWAVDPTTSKRRQVTKYADYDVKWPAIGPGARGEGEIVFQHGSELVLLDLSKSSARVVEVTIPGARPTLRARAVDASDYINAWDLSPNGKRLALSARGDVWTVPAKNGSPRNLTHSSSIAEREPNWSPDGKWIAYFSDQSGEYELYVLASDGKSDARRVTQDGTCFRAHPVWSPDSKHIVMTDKTGALYLCTVDSGASKLIHRDPWTGDLISEPPSWSHDSRWIAYSRADEASGVSSIWVYEMDTGENHRLTNGMFNDRFPQFDRVGDYLYFRSNRSFQPTYGELDTSFVYAGTEVLLVVPLRADMRSPLEPKSDEQEPEKKKEGDDDADEGGADKKDDVAKASGDASDKPGDDTKKDSEKKDKPREKVEIALEGFERRAVPIPVDNGLFGSIGVNDKGALIYARLPIQRGAKPAIHVINVKDDKPEEKLVAKDADGFGLTPDGKKLLIVRDDNKAVILDAAADAKEEAVSLEGMTAWIEPREEWSQLFTEAWRLERDWFYDPRMHNVDWQKVRDEYAPMITDCVTREDVSYVIREMISELNAGHAYYSGGDTGKVPQMGTGLLGCDFELADNGFKIAKIHEGGPWDVDGRGPLSQPGVDVKVGDYVLAVNGVAPDIRKDPYAAFQGMSGRTITLTVSDKPRIDDSARTVVVKAQASERDLRFRAWIEKNRAYVDKATDGKVGYIYVQSTGVDGQNDLVRQFYGQIAKSALIIDERWNSGGQIPTRFIELLNRPITNYWARRDSKDWQWPPDAHPGPKCMLINGLSGSGGDAFPGYFKMMGLGQLIGTRTWGGLIGISGNPSLIDGGSVTVPTFGYYEKDGTWGIEGHGVDPDIEVIDDPSQMLDGGDPQLDRAIALMLSEIEKRPYVAPKRPAYPDRSGMGLPASDR